MPHQPKGPTRHSTLLNDDAISPLFLAAIEATEEAILNSLTMAATMKGRGGLTVESIPMEKVMDILRAYKRVDR
jgi:D-aminopeptidase